MHAFANFEKWEDHSNPTVLEAFEHSINNSFIRIMRDIVLYYQAQTGIETEKLLSDGDDPNREAFLRRFADQDGRRYLGRFWNELSADPQAIDEQTRQHYALLYARPHAIHDAFNQFGAFSQDAIDNKALLAKGKLTMPVLAIGAEKSFGTAMADDIRFVATNVQMGVVPRSGHWVMEENPRETMDALLKFL